MTTPFGMTDIYHLSTGSKTLLNILHFPDKIFTVISIGGNAVALLSKFAETSDITVQCNYILPLTDYFSSNDFFHPISINGTLITTKNDYYKWWEVFEDEDDDE